MTESKQPVDILWWIPLTRGIILVLFSIAMFTFGRGTTLVAMITILGAYWMVDGVFDLFEGVVGQVEGKRIWKIVSAVISMAAGFMIVSNPILSGFFASTFFISLIGFVAVSAGIASILARSGRKRSVPGILLGALYLVFGVLILFNPIVTQALIIVLLPYWALGTGILALGTGAYMRLRKQPAPNA